MGGAALRRFAVVLASVGVALHITSLDENPSQGFVTEGFAVLLLALVLGDAPVTRASCSRWTWPPPNRPTSTNNAEPLVATHTLQSPAVVASTMSLDYRRLGSIGTRASELCFGTWRFGRKSSGVLETDEEEVHEFLNALEKRDRNFTDTANIYGNPSGTSEEYVGNWLAERDREDYVLALRVYFPFDEDNPNGRGLSRAHIRNQIEGTLNRLDTDYLDLYYIHYWDEETPIEETFRTLSGLIEEGKVNYLDVSTTVSWQLTKALQKFDVDDYARFDVTQLLFYTGYYEDVEDYLDICGDQDIVVCLYSPFAGGFLTGKYERVDSHDPAEYVAPDGARGSFDEHFDRFYVSERGWKVLDEIHAVADEVDASPAQAALRWLMDYPKVTVVPIVGARTTDQPDENVDAADVDISTDQWECIMNAHYDEDGRRWDH